MQIANRWPLVVTCLFALTLLSGTASAQFDKLINHVPRSVNTIILLNAEEVFNSEIALQEGWREGFERAVIAGMAHLPADTQQYLLASQTDFQYMHPVWQVGVLTTEKKHDMAYIASRLKGRRDTIAGLPTVLLPSDNYLVQFDATTYGTFVPASRQAVARWVESSASELEDFAPYIQEAIGYVEEAGTEVIMALDLANVLDRETVEQLVSDNETLREAKVDADKATEALLSLRGVMLGITFGTEPFGSIKVDFGKDITVLGDIAPQLLLDALAKRGAMIDDFAQWKPRTDAKQVRLSGKLSPAGLRKIFSLVDAPTATSVAGSSAVATQQETTEPDSPLAATQKYFSAVNEFIDDLRSKEPQRLSQYGVWFDKYARKIDQLPMVNVDPEMLDYGQYVAQQFRNAASAIQGSGIRKRVRQVQAVDAAGDPGYWGKSYDGGGYYHQGYYYQGGYGYGRGNYQQAELRQQQSARIQINAQERAVGASAARTIMQEIDKATSMVRRKMTEKYSAEF